MNDGIDPLEKMKWMDRVERKLDTILLFTFVMAMASVCIMMLLGQK